MDKKVSVVIPVYNVERYLAECLDSVVNQTYGNLEILAVNDGSKDSSGEILAAYALKDPRIIVLDKPNGGLSDARNFGMDHMSGEYVAFIDSDDVIDASMIGHLLEAAEKTDSEIAVSDMEYFYEDGRVGYSDGGQFSCTNVRKSPELIAINNSACNKLFRSRLFRDVRFPKGLWYEDLATIPILLYKAGSVVKVNEPLYRYRQRSGSIAHSADRRIFDIYTALDTVRDYVKAAGNEPEVLSRIHSLYAVHGLELTTLRIRDFDDRSIRKEYLAENMKRLFASCPDYMKDPIVKKAGWKKKMIFGLLNMKKYDMVLKLYDR
ncbi:MAG: glycosyltransferase [Solobacterium sp.]|nr:glycosyltransferase [Solobacterium sp.]